MKMSIRRLSALLAFALVFGLFAAFPAIGVGAESVNLALDGTYMYTIQSAVHSRSIDGDRTTTYGAGILNNGQKPDYDHNTAAQREQFSYVQRTALTAAGFEITFDLGASATIENVIVTGYHYTSTFGITPSTTDAALHISVSDTVDGEYTELGSQTIAAMGATAQAYIADIAAAGTGRFVKITMDNPAQYLLFSEIEIMGEKAASEDPSTDDATTEDVTSDDVTSDDVTSDDASSDDTSSDDTSSDDNSSDDGGDDPIIEDDVVTANIAGNATYRGTDNANGTGNYGEENWNIYHAGKLNDGVIPEGDSESTKGQNVEIYITGFVAGTVYVYFDLGKEETINEVVTYTNERLSSTNRGYPAIFNVYVGNSEDLASATLFGAATTTDEGAVRKYTATGNATGSFVILELGIASPDIVIALNEVEIYAVQEPINHAPNAEYKGEGDDNGTSGSYCEVGAEWNEYHTGKLNDGTIATDASNTQTGVSVEFSNAGYANGINYLTFKFDYEVDVREVVAYFNSRTTGGNRGYPATVNVYVGNSEDIAEATLIGAASTTDEGYVRAYSVTGSAKGTYVIFEMDIASPVAVIALTEVEIMGYGDAPAAPETPKLEAPILSSSTDKFTFTIPSITWEAVENAVAYDVYLDGVLVAENVTELSYTPVIETRADYTSSNAYKVTVVAKTGSEDYLDSAASEAVEIIYVDMPTDIDGNPLGTADFVLDAGHGGTDPGALGDGGAREEADDTLAMTLEVGKRLTALGFTVAYTRITDVYDSPLTKAAKGQAGSFGYYICLHRNSFSDERASGVETLYKPNDSGSNKALAQLVQDEIIALGVFTNRGLKERTDLTVLNNVTSMPVILAELSFISSPTDNEKFDTYFNDIATAIVKGAVANAGYKLGFEGAVVVNENDYTIHDEELAVHITVPNYDAENSVVDIEFVVANGLGVNGVSVNLNGGEWVELEPDNSFVYLGLDEFKTAAVHYTYQQDFFGAEPGLYTLKYKLTHALEAGQIYTGESMFLTINITVEEDPGILGDVNGDEEVDNLDASLILKYDAALIEEDGLDMDVADVNDDGYVDNLDATMILKYDAGIIDRIGPIEYITTEEKTNYAFGKSYTVTRDITETDPNYLYLNYSTGDAAWSDLQLTKMTDGIVGDITDMDYAGTYAAKADVSVMLVGTNKLYEYIIDLGDYYGDINSFVFRNVRDSRPGGGNRGFKLRMAYVSDDGTNWNKVNGESAAEQVEGAPEIKSNADPSVTNVEHFNYTYNLNEPAQGRYVRVIIVSDGGYVIQLEEIEIRN